MTAPRLALLLDDDPSFGALLGFALENSGVKVVQATRIGRVAQALNGATPDLYIVDGLLPDGNGLEFIEALRRRDRAVPVAFVSAFWKDLHSFDRLRKELGVAVIAQKPIVPLVFAAQIHALLPGRPVAPVAPAPPPANPSIAPARAAGRALVPEPPPALDALRQAYARKLPALVDQLTRAARGDDGEGGEERLLAHRLRGTAGSYGLEEVATLAAAVERALDGPGDATGLPALLAHLAQAAASAATPRTAEAPLAGAPAPEEAIGRVLLVGLGAARGDRLAQLLGAAGLEVRVAATWAEGLGEARRHPPQVVVAAGAGEPPRVRAAASELHRDLDACVILIGGATDAAARVAAARAGVALLLPGDAEPERIASAARDQVLARAAERPTVLVVDDDPAFVERVQATLRAAGLRAHGLGDPGRLLETLHALRPDALLLDVVMPGFGGIDLCRMLRGIPEWQDLPILLLTAQTDAETRLAAFAAGADDHLSKPVLDPELVARLTVRVDRHRLLHERADRDPLTGLLSRRAFLERLEARLSEARRHGRPLSVALLDVDRFKAVNDLHGHLTGDRVLSSLGAQLQRRLRREDLRGRWGGEELAVAFANEEAALAGGVIQGLLDGVEQLRFEGASGERFGVTFSAGVASYPADGETLSDLLAAADRRLYAAKRAGRARVCCAEEPAPLPQGQATRPPVSS